MKVFLLSWIVITFAALTYREGKILVKPDKIVKNTKLGELVNGSL